jgi:thiamine-phosphate pyrophosphorylase
MVSPHFYKLILVTHRIAQSIDDYLLFIKRCAFAGITAVQLREKNANADFVFEFGTQLKKILDPLQIPLITS